MYARLGGFITRGVNTVSGPFHPFGGAVDSVVVEQQDGSFKSSPWYVRFGKFQGVLKAKEKVVNISVNGVEANFHMYLDHKGEAYFLSEVDEEEEDSMLSPLSSGEEMDVQCHNGRIMKSESSNYDASQSNSVTRIGVSNGKVVTRTSSGRSRILGLFGSKSMKKDRYREEEEEEEEDGGGVIRADSLERAEIAADLLEVKWSTNLASGRHRKDNASVILDCEVNKDSQIKDGQSHVNSVVQGHIVHGLDNPVPVSHEDSGFSNHDMGNFSQSSFQKSETSVEAIGVEISCLITATSTLVESAFEDNNESTSETSRKIDKIGVANSDQDDNAKGVNCEIAGPHPQIPDASPLQACVSMKLDEEHAYDEDNGVSREENEADRLRTFIYCDNSESSRIGLHGFSKQANETLYSVHAETLHKTTELISVVDSQPETGMLVAKEPLNVHRFVGDENACNLFNDANILESETISSNKNSFLTETYSEMVTVHSVNDSAQEVQDEKNISEENKMNELRPSFEPIGDSREVTGEFIPIEAVEISTSEGSAEEQFLFSDLDEFKLSQVKCMESISLDHAENENLSSLKSEGIVAVNETFSSNYESDFSPDKYVRENLQDVVEELIENSKIISGNINIPSSGNVAGQEVRHIVESLPNMWSHFDELDVDHLHRSLGHSLDSKSKSSKWALLRKDVSSSVKSDADKEHQLSNSQPAIEDALILEELKNVAASPAVEDPSKVIDASSGSWRIWSFPFKRSRSMKIAQPLNSTRNLDVENALESTSGIDGEKEMSKPKVKKKKIRAITPTSEQLASLKLKEGRNTVTFTFSTAVLGQQQVDARIFLWRWDTRIVISDVDGTITKSDVLGQFMPMVGKDWSQTGVAHLFTAIKENGYQLLFLSARAISQAYHTRQFLVNLKQDGKALPDGPVVISPDGLFPSLFREVIRRAPHEFKIGCLEDIRALFPSDRNPFYAGFGNRDTDEFSYLKVGIPKGKIFIINPKGEVAVNRRVDTKSYTSLHALVNGMFPPMSSSEQEDFNSWNFWKLPPPVMDI